MDPEQEGKGLLSGRTAGDSFAWEFRSDQVTRNELTVTKIEA